jgi:hypothetical protein
MRSFPTTYQLIYGAAYWFIISSDAVLLMDGWVGGCGGEKKGRKGQDKSSWLNTVKSEKNVPSVQEPNDGIVLNVENVLRKK